MTLVVEKPRKGPVHIADEAHPGRAFCGQDINVFFVVPQASIRRLSRCATCQARVAEIARNPRTEATT